MQDAIQTAVGGNALTQVLKGEEVYNLTLRYLPQYRDTREAIENIRLLSPSGERVSLAQLCDVREADEGSEIYRENNQRYVAIKYSVRDRASGRRRARGHSKSERQVKLPRGYHIAWEGEYQSELRAEARMAIIVPLTVLLIFIILYSMYKSFKWAILILATVAMASIGRIAGAAGYRHTNSASLRRWASWRCSASPSSPASSCWNTSTSCARAAIRLRRQPSREPWCGCAPS